MYVYMCVRVGMSAWCEACTFLSLCVCVCVYVVNLLAICLSVLLSIFVYSQMPLAAEVRYKQRLFNALDTRIHRYAHAHATLLHTHTHRHIVRDTRRMNVQIQRSSERSSFPCSYKLPPKTNKHSRRRTSDPQLV